MKFYVFLPVLVLFLTSLSMNPQIPKEFQWKNRILIIFLDNLNHPLLEKATSTFYTAKEIIGR